MQVTLGLLADAANFTSNGKLNLLGAFSSISSNEVPMVYPLFVLVAVIRAGIPEKGTEHQFGIELTDAEARLVYSTANVLLAFNTDTSMPFAEIHLAIQIQGLVFPSFGVYEFHIVANKKRIHAIPLLVQPIVRPLMENFDEQR